MSKLQLRFKRRMLRITSPATASGPAGQALSIALTSNFPGEWGLLSGANLDVTGETLSVIDTSSAGVFSGVVVVVDGQGRAREKTVTLTVTGTASLGAITDFAVADMTINSAQFSFSNVAGATGYQVSVNGDDANPETLSGTKMLAGVLTADTDYVFKGRAFDSAVPPNFGPWSGEVTGHTDANPLPGPDPGVQAVRARVLTNSIVLQFRLNLAASTSPHRTATGWIIDHYAAMAAKGLLKARTSFGPASNASQQAVSQINSMHSTYGTRFELVLNSKLTDSPSATTLIERAHNYIDPDAIESFQGLNEPNNGQPAGWVNDLKAHTIAIWNKMRSYPEYDGKTMGSFSPWGRLTSDYDALLAGNWLAECAAFFDWLNSHNYTGGRNPPIHGAPDGTFEGGDPVNEYLLGTMGVAAPPLSAINDFQRLGPGKPMRISEAGWNYYGAAGEYWPARNPSAFFVSLEAQAKYMQVMHFEALLAGIDEVVWFEFIENYQISTPRYGMLKYTSTNGPFTRTPLYDTCLNLAAAYWDSGATAETFTPGSLDYSLSGAGFDGTIQSKLFQKSDGKFLLHLWQRHQSWKRTSPFGNVAAPVKSPVVEFNGGAPVATVRSNRPYINQTWADEGTNIASKAFPVPDDGLVVEITP